MNKYLSDYDKGASNGIVPLNENKKIDSKYLPAYTEANIIANDAISDLSAVQTWSSEQTYNYTEYGLTLKDTINGVATGFKAPRGLFNQLFVDDIVFTRADKAIDSEIKTEIGFYTWQGVKNKSDISGAKKVASITNDGGLVLVSSTPNSSKYFKFTVDDTGSLKTSEYTYTSSNLSEINVVTTGVEDNDENGE